MCAQITIPLAHTSVCHNVHIFPYEVMAQPAHPFAIQAVRIADMELDKECTLERSQVVSAAPSRMPYIATFGKYNKRWYVDVVSLPHNAMRYLLSNLFVATTSLHRLALDITSADLDLYMTFLVTAVDFMKALLTAEEHILFVEIDLLLAKRLDIDNHPLNKINRQIARRKMLSALELASEVHVTYMPTLTIAEHVRSALESFSAVALEYFCEKEKILPRLVSKRFRSSRDKTKAESKLLRELAQHELGYKFAALLVCSLGSKNVIAEFASRNFGKSSEKKLFLDAVQQIRNEYLPIPHVMEVSAEKYAQIFSMERFLLHYGPDRNLKEVTTVVAQ